MQTERTIPPPRKKPGVLPFAIAITVLNILGHTWLGFEQPWLTPFVAVFTAYACEISIEIAIQGWRNARFRGSPSHLLHFLLPAHISGLAVGMLLTQTRISPSSRSRLRWRSIPRCCCAYPFPARQRALRRTF